MRILYSLAMYLGIPLILVHLAWRGLRDRDYLKRWSERFGRFAPPAGRNGIVLHAASVGEVNAASPLVRALLDRFPGAPFTLTTFTPTGSARAMELFGERVFHIHAPLDLPGAVRRFFARLEPRLLIVMETEIWPNLYAGAARRNIPLLLANARISGKSQQGYGRWPVLVRAALDPVAWAGAQSPADAARLVALGARPDRVEITGNLKFEMDVSPEHAARGLALREKWGKARPVLLAGSTHEADDATVIEAFQSLLARHADALLVVVPRHPERFADAARMTAAAGLEAALHSRGVAGAAGSQCLVVDGMGMLMDFYAACDVAVVGGSFSEVGGHNVLEPAALARPVLVGPHTFNFADITRQMIAHGAAMQVDGAAALAEQVDRLFTDAALRERMGRAGREMIAASRGALDHTVAAVEKYLPAG